MSCSWMSIFVLWFVIDIFLCPTLVKYWFILNMLMRVFGNHKVCRNCLRRLRTLNKSFQREGSSHSWRSASVRSTFLDFFCGKHEHLFVPSSSIIAKKGEGSYFTNAGMNQVNIYFALILKSLYLLFKLWRCLLYKLAD